MKEKTKLVLGCVLTGLLVCALIASLTLSAVTLHKVNSVSASLNPEGGDAAKENDVVIADEYVIKSTEKISDAYKSGSTDGLSDREKETLDMASAVLDKIIDKGMSPYEKELAVYDWMTGALQFEAGALLVIPDTNADCDNPYGVLKHHNAVCVGYATTFRLFMQMMDIECMVVHNDECYHSWDLVKLDGEWYHTDIYSDSHGGNYAHFNLSDNQMASQQSWNRDFFPAAEGYKYSYAYQNMTECADIYSVPAAVREMMDNQEGTRAFCFDSEITEEDAQIVEVMMQNIQSIVENCEEFWGLWMSWSWLSTDKGYVLCVNIEGYEEGCDDPVIEIPDEAYEKIDEVVGNCFGDLDSWENDWDSEDWYEEDILG